MNSLVETWGEPEPEVLEGLVKGKNGLLSSLHNVVTVLESDTRWAGRVAFNSFAGQLFIDQCPVEDGSETRVRLWLERVYGLRPSVEVLGRALSFCGESHPVHPVRAWLSGLVWDGVDRLSTLFERFFGAAGSPLLSSMGVAWLVGAVARVFQLGCKLDTMVVLVGPQGVGKSSGCAALMPDGGWFSDSALDLRNKDAFLQLRGVWLYELAELRGMNGTSPEVIKAFLSSRCDRFRAPYARHTESRARQCFFVGTTNDRNFLRDQTGARRFWPVLVGRVDGVGLQQVRDQLWAEARVRYEAGARWWLSEGQEAELGALAADYAVMDPWEERILVWVREQGEPFTVRQVLEMLGVPLERQDRRCSSRVGALLAQLGCEQGRPSGVGARPRVWWWPKEAV